MISSGYIAPQVWAWIEIAMRMHDQQFHFFLTEAMGGNVSAADWTNGFIINWGRHKGILCPTHELVLKLMKEDAALYIPTHILSRRLGPRPRNMFSVNSYVQE